MPKYQVSFDRRDRLTIEIEAYNEDDAVEAATVLLRDLKDFDIDSEEIEFRDVEEATYDDVEEDDQ